LLSSSFFAPIIIFFLLTADTSGDEAEAAPLSRAFHDNKMNWFRMRYNSH